MTAMLLLALLSSAGAQELQLDWSAPSACPNAAQVQTAIEQTLGRPLAAADALLRLSATVTSTQGRFSAALQLKTDAGISARTLQAQTCVALVDAVALIAVLSLDAAEQARATKTATVARGPVIPARVRAVASSGFSPALQLQAGGVVHAGAIPGPAAGVSVGGAVELFRWMGVGELWAQLDVRYLFERDARVGTGEAGGAFSLFGGAGRACFRRPFMGFYRQWSASGCLGAELGWLRAAGFNVEQPGASSALWGAVSGALEVSVQLWRAVWWSTRASVGRPLFRASFVLDNVGEVFQTPEIFAVIAFGVSFYFR